MLKIRQFLMYCPSFLAERNTLLKKIAKINSNLNQIDAVATVALNLTLFVNLGCEF